MPVQRGDEILRQWSVLIAISQSADCSYDSLAARFGKAKRTIQRDIETLSLVFPVEEVWVGHKKCWRLERKAMGKLAETSFTFAELCAFYVHRGQLACAGGAAIDPDLGSALDKVGSALGPKMRKYLDQVAGVLSWKPEAAGLPGDVQPGAVKELMRAAIDHKRVRMDYHSFASGKVKPYVVEPARLTAGNGGLYLYAFVPAYGEMRTFAVQRIRKLSVTDEAFSPVVEAGADPYDKSIGIWAGGKVELVEIEFGPSVAAYVKERQFDDSQQVSERPDGSLRLRMKKAIDLPLRSWLLGFGHHVRVLRPAALAEAIFEELEEARLQYAPRMEFELPLAIHDDVRQRSLPFAGSRRGRTVRTSRSSPQRP
jgi:predicted DNA-binding transcriptional regulator YafY